MSVLPFVPVYPCTTSILYHTFPSSTKIQYKTTSTNSTGTHVVTSSERVVPGRKGDGGGNGGSSARDRNGEDGARKFFGGDIGETRGIDGHGARGRRARGGSGGKKHGRCRGAGGNTGRRAGNRESFRADTYRYVSIHCP
jgi:hypothetical protein